MMHCCHDLYQNCKNTHVIETKLLYFAIIQQIDFYNIMYYCVGLRGVAGEISKFFIYWSNAMKICMMTKYHLIKKFIHSNSPQNAPLLWKRRPS